MWLYSCTYTHSLHWLRARIPLIVHCVQFYCDYNACRAPWGAVQHRAQDSWLEWKDPFRIASNRSVLRYSIKETMQINFGLFPTTVQKISSSRRILFPATTISVQWKNFSITGIGRWTNGFTLWQNVVKQPLYAETRAHRILLFSTECCTCIICRPTNQPTQPTSPAQTLWGKPQPGYWLLLPPLLPQYLKPAHSVAVLPAIYYYSRQLCKNLRRT